MSVCEVRTAPPASRCLAQRLEVLDDPVVHNDELAGWVGVGMRVEITGYAVRRPTGVPNSYGPGQRFVLEARPRD